jgi:hypothetical protein
MSFDTISWWPTFCLLLTRPHWVLSLSAENPLRLIWTRRSEMNCLRYESELTGLGEQWGLHRLPNLHQERQSDNRLRLCLVCLPANTLWTLDSDRLSNCLTAKLLLALASTTILDSGPYSTIWRLYEPSVTSTVFLLNCYWPSLAQSFLASVFSRFMTKISAWTAQKTPLQ